MDSEAQQIIAVGVAVLLICVGVGSCTKIIREPVEPAAIPVETAAEEVNK